jgi:hypothetical protein
MKHFQTYELGLSKLGRAEDAQLSPVAIQAACETFHNYRGHKLSSIETGIAEWNDAVASAVDRVGQQNGLATIEMGPEWHTNVSSALRDMKAPLHSEVILSTKKPFLSNSALSGRLRVFGALTMSENPEFMPSTTAEWPRFPYFLVEPGTAKSLADQELVLLGNPPSVDQDEPDMIGAAIASVTYARSPTHERQNTLRMVSDPPYGEEYHPSWRNQTYHARWSSLVQKNRDSQDLKVRAISLS